MEDAENNIVLDMTLDDLNSSDLLRFADSENILIVSKSVQEDEDLRNLQKLFLPSLQNSGITFRSLIYLSKDDIKEAISDIGLRAEFRSKLFAWKKNEHNIDDDTITYNSKVASWLQTVSLGSNTPNSGISNSISKLSKGLSNLLNESNKGKAVIQYYKNNSCLDRFNRDVLVSIILEDVQYSKTHLSPKDYLPILQEIVSIFPTEIDFQDYYFFSRKKGKNPGGRLYNKYINSTIKIKKRIKHTHTESLVENKNLPNSQEYDADILYALKASLQRDFSNFSEVCDKWEKTFVLRRQELTKCDSANIVNFLKDWPLYAHAQAHVLINLEFRLMFPGKDTLLYSKWEEFKKKIKKFYVEQIKDKSSKALFSSISDKTDRNSEDYILIALLNSVILPTSRFSVENGSKKRKITINDAQECFTLRIATINDFDHGVEQLREKQYNRGITLQPLIVVVGLRADLLTDYFVYFDKCRQRHDSYLSCLDTCFKNFHVLCLEYPQASYGPWIFIQKFVFQIETEFDKPLPSVSSLTAYLNNQ